MPNFGAAWAGVPLTFDGSTSFTPSATEMLGGIMGFWGQGLQGPEGRLNGQQSQAVTVLEGGAQVVGGAVDIGLAVTTDVGSAGALTPIDAVALAGGVASVLSGISTVAKAFNLGDTPTPTTSPVDAGAVAIAVWEFSIGSGSAAYQLSNAASYSNEADTVAGEIYAQVTGPGSPANVAIAVWDTNLEGVPAYARVTDIDVATATAVAQQSAGQVLPWVQNALVFVEQATLNALHDDLVPAQSELLAVSLAAVSGYATRLAWAQGQAPSWTWTETSFLVGVSGGFYVLVNVTAEAFDRCINYVYTPSSGPPTRSVLGDTNLLLSLIPLQY